MNNSRVYPFSIALCLATLFTVTAHEENMIECGNTLGISAKIQQPDWVLLESSVGRGSLAVSGERINARRLLDTIERSPLPQEKGVKKPLHRTKESVENGKISKCISYRDLDENGKPIIATYFMYFSGGIIIGTYSFNEGADGDVAIKNIDAYMQTVSLK